MKVPRALWLQRVSRMRTFCELTPEIDHLIVVAAELLIDGHTGGRWRSAFFMVRRAVRQSWLGLGMACRWFWWRRVLRLDDAAVHARIEEICR